MIAVVKDVLTVSMCALLNRFEHTAILCSVFLYSLTIVGLLKQRVIKSFLFSYGFGFGKGIINNF